MLNISFLGTVGYQYYKQSTYWTSPFGYKMKTGHFLFEELSLRPDQLRTMMESAERFRMIIDGKMQEIGAKRNELVALLRQDNTDKKAIATVVSKISAMQEQMQWTVAMHILNMKAGLDKEQKKKFLDLIEDAMAQRRQLGCPIVPQR
jgi:Spy/CpxP family protein refolding chaperone